MTTDWLPLPLALYLICFLEVFVFVKLSKRWPNILLFYIPVLVLSFVLLLVCTRSWMPSGA